MHAGVVLGTGFAAVLMRQMRSSMLDSLGADYVRTARAKGLSEWSVVGSHALRNSLITVTTLIGLDFGALISGAVVTETIFGIAGLRPAAIDAINQRDYPMIQGVVLVTAAGYVIVNLLVDVVYSLLDPRIRVAVSCRRHRSPLRRARARGGGACCASASCAGPWPSPASSSSSLRRRSPSFAPWIAPYDAGADRLQPRPRAPVVAAPARDRRARPRRPLAPRSGARARRCRPASSRRCSRC